VLLLSGASLLALAATAFYPVALLAMLLCGTLWDVLFVESLTAMQTEAGEHGALFTGLFFSISLLGVTAGTLLVGLLFDAVGIGIGLAACAATLWAYALARVRWAHARAPA
jgi:predicted MFS family arabinose efflux permease